MTYIKLSNKEITEKIIAEMNIKKQGTLKQINTKGNIF